MANPEHVQIVKQGAAAIHAFRDKNPDVRLELSEADLDGVNLSGADLNLANLRGAHLMQADLRDADLNLANLRGAYLTRANLSSATLNNAKLNGANLWDADLSKARLIGADLSGASMIGINLIDANLGSATVVGAQLDSTAKLNGIQCYITTVDRWTAEYMRTTLTRGQLMDLIIVDDLATLRAEFGGVWGAIHLLGVLVFLLPYVWFLGEQAMAARARAIADSAIISAEEWAHRHTENVIPISANDFQIAVQERITGTAEQWRERFGLAKPREISIARALGRYIWNGGERWREGYFFKAWSFIPFTCVALYNMFRLTLLIKTKKLETQENVRQLPVIFSMGTGWFSWRTAYQLNRIGYWLTLALITKNTVYFMSSTIQI